MSETIDPFAFGSWLREVRLSRQWTLRKFAKEIDVSPTYLSSLENGSTPPPTLERLRRISEVLGIDMDEATSRASRWQDAAKEAIQDNSELVHLFRLVKDMAPNEIKEVVKRAEEVKQNND